MSEHEDQFILWIEGYLRGTLSPEERQALTERVARDAASRAIFENQVRLSLELGAWLRPEDRADARRRAALVLGVSSDTRRRRVIESTEKRLGMRFRPNRFPKAWMAGAAAFLAGATVLVAALMRSPRPETVEPKPEAAANADAREQARRELAEREKELSRTREELRLLEEEGRKARERLAQLEREKQTPSEPPTLEEPGKKEEERRKAEAALAQLEARQRAAQAEMEKAEAARQKALEEKPPRDAKTAPSQDPIQTTVVAAAQVLETVGEVYLVAGNDRRRGKPGDTLLAGMGIETVGPLSIAAIQFPDSTWLQLWGDSALGQISDPQEPNPQGEKVGKSLHLSRGILSTEAVKQPEGRPMVLTTPHGRVRMLGTALRLAVDGGAQPSTRLEVTDGKVRFTRTSDGKTIDVAGGYYAVAAPGLELAPRLFQQQKPAKLQIHPKIDPKKADAAIERGLQWLAALDLKPKPIGQIGELRYSELVLYTMLHAGVSPGHPSFQSLLSTVLEQKLEITYNVVLQAMILSELDPEKYQDRIAQCGQFLVDNQCANGQWYYGTPTLPVAVPPSKDVATGKPGEKKGTRTKPSRTLQLKRQREGPGTGDNSNAQYAALGLRACIEALVFPPKETLDLARNWWVRTQNEDGGCGYGNDHYPLQKESYGSMTAGGLGSLVVYEHFLGQDWKADPAVNKAVRWIAGHAEVKQNPLCKNTSEPMLSAPHYYLYALERAGVFLRLDKFGAHDWYREGAIQLLVVQNADGSWDKDGRLREHVASTCFAILFLRKSTPALLPVASTDRFVQRDKR